MGAPSQSAPEMARKVGARLQAHVLQRLASVTQERAAQAMGLSASTLSRFVSEGDLERACDLLGVLGLRLTTDESMVVDPDLMHGLECLAFEYLRAKRAGSQHAA